MATMRELIVVVLDVVGLGLLVAGAWATWGLGAGLAALGFSSILVAFYFGEVVPRRKGPG